MDLVLGLSVTSTAVRWVLVEGVTGDGDAVDRGVLDVGDSADFDAEALLTVLLDANEAVVESGLHAAGVTWTPAGEAIAGAILEAFQARGLQNAIAVSEPEAAEALASGISAISGYEDVAVCVFEPDATLIALVNADGVIVESHDIVEDRDVELSASVMALELNDRRLDAIFVVGSADLDPVVSSMDSVAAAPVISSAEGDMAMARGAAVASAMAVNSMGGGSRSLLGGLRGMSRTSALTSVVVAAAVTLVISLSVVLGLQATSDSPPETTNANATGEPLQEGKMGVEAKAALAAPKLEQRPAAPAPKPATKRAPMAKPAPDPQRRRSRPHRPRLRRCRKSIRLPLCRPLRPTCRRSRSTRRPHPRTPRLHLRMSRPCRRSPQCSRNRVCATRSSSAFRSSTGSTTRSRCTRRTNCDTVVHGAESQRTQAVFVTSSLRRDTVLSLRHRPERRLADTRPCRCRQAVARFSRAPSCSPHCPSRGSAPSAVAAPSSQIRSRWVSRRVNPPLTVR